MRPTGSTVALAGSTPPVEPIPGDSKAVANLLLAPASILSLPKNRQSNQPWDIFYPRRAVYFTLDNSPGKVPDLVPRASIHRLLSWIEARLAERRQEGARAGHQQAQLRRGLKDGKALLDTCFHLLGAARR